MRIAIVGAGAVGCLFGALLTGAGHGITLVCRDARKARRLRDTGIALWEGESRTVHAVEALATPVEPPAIPYDLVLIVVKAFDTESAAEAAHPLLAPATPVLTLQNGLGPADILARRLGAERLLAGITAQGATLLDVGEVRHGGAGQTLLGPYLPDGPKREELAELFTAAGIPARWEPHIHPALWKKLAASAGINALTALTGIRNGLVASHPDAALLAREAVREAAAVALALGIDLGDPEVLGDWVLDVARVTAQNRSSMGQDVDRKRRTEVDAINGAVARLGAAHGVDTPVNRTLARLVSTLEANFPTSSEQGR